MAVELLFGGPEDSEIRYIDKLRNQLLDSVGLDSIPEPQPLIRNVLYRNSLIWLIGAPGDGKSFVALDMAGCVGTGEPWQEHDIAYPNYGVLYLVAEGASGLRQRVRAWEASYGRTMTGVTFLPVAVPASKDKGHWHDLIDLVTEQRAAMVILDTQARVTLGMEENSAKDMGEFVEQLERLRNATGAAVVTVHHQGRAGDHMRGSSSLEGAADTIWRVAKEGSLITMTNTKQKNAEASDELLLKLSKAYDSAVLISASPSERMQMSAAVRSFAQQWWDLFGDEEVSVTKLCEGTEASKTAVYRHIAALLRSSLAVKKTASNRTTYMLPVAPNPTT